MVGVSAVLRDRQDVRQLRHLLGDSGGHGGVPHHLAQLAHQHRQHHRQARRCACSPSPFAGKVYGHPGDLQILDIVLTPRKQTHRELINFGF